jgi:hypothetical protein
LASTGVACVCMTKLLSGMFRSGLELLPSPPTK